jgi:anthranilate phosphoribosyltransferase
VNTAIARCAKAGNVSAPTTLELRSLIADLGCGELDEGHALTLMQAMLEAGVVPRDVEAVLRVYGARSPALSENIGFLRALDRHVHPLHAPADRPRPVVIPSYGGTRAEPHLTALLALLLRRYGIAVLIHGMSSPRDAPSRRRDEQAAGVTMEEILLELGVAPAAADIAHAQARLARDDIVYVSLDVLAPGLARLLREADKTNRNASVLPLALLLDPFGGDGYRAIGVHREDGLASMRQILVATHANALLWRGSAGEQAADSARPMELESYMGGVAGDAVAGTTAALPASPQAPGAAAAAALIARVLEGEVPIPDSILAQLAFCLAGARRT